MIGFRVLGMWTKVAATAVSVAVAAHSVRRYFL